MPRQKVQKTPRPLVAEVRLPRVKGTISAFSDLPAHVAQFLPLCHVRLKHRTDFKEYVIRTKTINLAKSRIVKIWCKPTGLNIQFKPPLRKVNDDIIDAVRLRDFLDYVFHKTQLA